MIKTKKIKFLLRFYLWILPIATLLMCCFIVAIVLCSCQVDKIAGNSQNSKAVTVISDSYYPPFEYLNDEGKYIGIDVEIIREIFTSQNIEYKFEPLGYDISLQAIKANRKDVIISALTITEDRKEFMDFSDAYFTSALGVCINNKSGITQIEQLYGKTIGVQSNTQNEKWLKEMQNTVTLNVKSYTSTNTMYSDLNNGTINAIVDDTVSIKYNTKQFSNINIIYETDENSPYYTKYGIGVSKEAKPELLDKINQGLATIKENGKLQEILDKYL